MSRRTPVRIKVACINWSHPDAPHALVYVVDNHGRMTPASETYHPTWGHAMAWAGRLAGVLARTHRDQAAPTEPQHDTTLDAMVIDASDQRHDAPRAGFTARQEEM